jgi:hypothetical protein
MAQGASVGAIAVGSRRQIGIRCRLLISFPREAVRSGTPRGCVHGPDDMPESRCQGTPWDSSVAGIGQAICIQKGPTCTPVAQGQSDCHHIGMNRAVANAARAPRADVRCQDWLSVAVGKCREACFAGRRSVPQPAPLLPAQRFVLLCRSYQVRSSCLARQASRDAIAPRAPALGRNSLVTERGGL